MSSSLEACSPAGDLVIKGGLLNFANQIDNHHHHDAGPPESKALAKLSRHCAFGAFLDSIERTDPPRCSPKTRVKLIGEMKGWATGKALTSSVMWLTGSAGSGKTALSQTTAEELKKEGYVLGCHFFYRTSKDGARSDGYCWVPNLVHQMIRELPETLPFVERAIRSDDSLFERQVNSVFEDLFLKPLLKAFPTRFSFRSTFRRFLGIQRTKTHIPRLVVVDGLDECKSSDMQILILRTIANAIHRLPIPLRVLIASRPETHIRMSINQVFSNVPFHRINLDEDQDVRKDLEAYYSDRFDQIRREHPSLRGQEKYANWPSQHDVNFLVSKSSTQFIFASTVMNYISHPRQHPVKRLEVILGKLITPRQDRPFAALDTLYTVILLSVEETDRRMVRLILTFIYLAGKGEFPELNLEATPTFLEGFLDLQSGDVARLLDPLVSLLTLPETPSGMISMLHASFFDYFRDADRSEELVMSLGDAHEAIVSKLSEDILGDQATIKTTAILYHASHATASQKLILNLYSLLDKVGSEDHILSFLWQLYDLLCSKLGVAKQAVDLPDNSDQLSVMQTYKFYMATLTVQHAYHSTREADMTFLLEQIRSVVIPKKVTPDSKGKLSVKLCVPLIRQLVNIGDSDGRVLDRPELLDILEDPDNLGPRAKDIAFNVLYYLDLLWPAENNQNRVGGLVQRQDISSAPTRSGGRDYAVSLSDRPLLPSSASMPSGARARKSVLRMTQTSSGEPFPTWHRDEVRSRWREVTEKEYGRTMKPAS